MSTNTYSIPRANSPIADNGGVTTQSWYNFLRSLASLQDGGDTDLQAQITQIAIILGSPDGTVENIPPLSGISGKITATASVYARGQLPGLVQLSLVNDNPSPASTSFYGTDNAGDVGWQPMAGAFATTTLDLSADGTTGVVSYDLEALADSGIGAALVRITRDTYGRISGTHAATTSDLSEGTNLYFTDERAQAIVDASSGVPTSVPTATTYLVPSDRQVLWTIPIELVGTASLDISGALVEVN